MQFEKYNVYDFQYAGFIFQNGGTYFGLTYDGNKTLPGYEDSGLVYRVEILEFQKQWSSKEEIWNSIPCFVAGFVKDIDGKETSFPILKQDICAILQKFYTIGKSYPFTIVAVPGELNDKQEPIDCYIVRDQLDFEHQLHTSAEYKTGDSIELTVDKFGPKWLVFADPVRQKIKELFEIGKEYNFLIEAEEFNEKSGKNFFTLRDEFEGFIHRFYFVDEHPASPGEKIKLTVKGVSPKGWLLLAEPGKQISAEELQTIEQIEDNTLGRENEQLEYKSSFVYTASGEENIDLQLGREIMQQLAAFMNAKGGTVCLGYRDDGSVCGINNDIPHLNSSSEDQYTYKLTLDGIELKIRNTISRKLGGFANSQVDIKFRKNEKELLVCHLIANPSAKPIYLNRTDLYKRSGNMCQHLKGDEITFFILDHLTRIMQNAKLAFTVPVPTPVPGQGTDTTTEVKQEEKDKEITYIPTPNTKDEKILQYITLYKNGTVSRQKNPSAAEDVLYNIPFTASCKNKSSRLLLCYDNGCVNVLNPGAVVSGKLKTENKTYSNGFNTKAALLSVFTCSKDDYLVIRSRKLSGGADMIKAIAIDSYAVHDPQSMKTQGNKVLEVKNAELSQYELVPGEQSSFIYPIIVKSKNGALGVPARSASVQNVLAFLKKRKRDAEADDARN